MLFILVLLFCSACVGAASPQRAALPGIASPRPPRCCAGQGYIADRELATTVHLALAMRRPLFLEGEPGTGKTEIAKVLAAGLGRRLVRLQCYDGMDLSAAAYEWDHARQLMAIRLAEAAGETDRDELAHGHLRPRVPAGPPAAVRRSTPTSRRRCC